MAVTLGNAFGSTIAFTTNTTFAPYLTSISIDGIERGDSDTSHLGLTAHGATTDVSAMRTFVPGGLIDPGTITLGWMANMNFPGVTASGTTAAAMIAKAAEIITITFANTATTASTLAFTGYLKSVSVSGDAEAAWNGQMVFKAGGPVTWVAAA